MTEMQTAITIFDTAEKFNAVVAILEPSVRVDYPNHLVYLDESTERNEQIEAIFLALLDGRDLVAIQEDAKKDRSWFRCWKIVKDGKFQEQSSHGTRNVRN